MRFSTELEQALLLELHLSNLSMSQISDTHDAAMVNIQLPNDDVVDAGRDLQYG